MAKDRLELRSKENFMDREFGRSAGSPEACEPGLVFLIMPLNGGEYDRVFDVYRSECTRLGLHAVRADSVPDSGFILKFIVEMIEKAEFIICDLSLERPNVYYELGYAHGVGNPANRIFLTATAATRLHFDIAPLRVHFYEDTKALRQLVRTEFKGLVRTVREKAVGQQDKPVT